MTETEFIRKLMQQGQPLKLLRQTIDSEVHIKQDIVASGVILKRCTFEGPVFFENIDLNFGIKFIDCTFKKSLHFFNCKAEEFDPNINIDNCHLNFINTTIEGLYLHNNNILIRGIRIAENCIINSLEIDSLICSSGNISITGSSIKSKFDISRVIVNEISIRDNSNIYAALRLENIETNWLVFSEATFNESVFIIACIVKHATFQNGSFSKNVSFEATSIPIQLTIVGTEFKESLKFNLWNEAGNVKGSLSKVHISSAKFGDQFIVNGNNFEIDEVFIHTSKQLDGAIHFNSSQIIKTKITGDSYNNIVFNHCSFNNLHFGNYYNYSTLSFISAKSVGTASILTIEHSNMGKTHLFNVFLNTFAKIDIYNSILTEIQAANVSWFDDDKLNVTTSKNNEIFKQKREIYRQLKYALEKQGNKILSLRFKALEMKTFKKESFSSAKWYKRIFNNDRLILWLEQTNDYGNSWIKPVLLAIVFAIIFHFFIIIGVSEELSFCINFSSESFNTTCKIYCENLKSLPQLMNPTHLLYRIFPGEDLSFKVHLLDYLLKIVMTFFIFQTVSAFRKYI